MEKRVLTDRSEGRAAVEAYRPAQIVSGGQTGVDRAALDAAIALGLPHGGYCPRGRRAEDGIIDRLYELRETPSRDYPQRTEWNVRESDATLVLHRGRPSGGTLLTIRLAERMARPCLAIDVDDSDAVERIAHWLDRIRPGVLNIAGPRESSSPGIRDSAAALLMRLFRSDSPNLHPHAPASSETPRPDERPAHG